MVKLYEKYDIILQNTGSKQEYVVSALTDYSTNTLYHQFDDFEMPEGAPEGEYIYVLIYNVRDDVEYTLKDDIMASIVKAGDFEIELRYLPHEVGVMKYGNIKQANRYLPKNKNFIYRKK